MKNNIYKFINKDDSKDIIFVNIKVIKNIHYWKPETNKTKKWKKMSNYNTIELSNKIYKNEFFEKAGFINLKYPCLKIYIEITKDIKDHYYARVERGSKYTKMENKHRVKVEWNETIFGCDDNKRDGLIWESLDTKKEKKWN